MKKAVQHRVISIVLVISMLLSLVPVFSMPVFASEQTGDDGTTNWDFIEPVTHQTSVPSGYIEIYTAQDLDNVRDNLSRNYILMNDIDLSSWGDWKPIGENSSTSFSGIFDGNGYSIENLKINFAVRPYAGLFSDVGNAEIKSLGVISANIDTSSNMGVGGIVGRAYDSVIKNCFFEGNIYSSSGVTAAGGIVGWAIDSTVTDSYAYGSIESTSYNTSHLSYAYSGGIVGTLSDSVIRNCYTIASVKAYSEYEDMSGIERAFAGGIAGAGDGYLIQPDNELRNCYYINTNLRGIGSTDGMTVQSVVALNDSQMRQQSSYVGFDFDNVWGIDPNINNGYPYLLAISPKADDSDGESDAVVYNGHMYKLYDIGMAWEDARIYCENLSGHLVTITTQGEQTLVESLLNEGNRNSYWIGGKQNRITGQYEWYTGEGMAYTNWGVEMPDNHGNQEDCMMVYKNFNPQDGNGFGEWNDLNGNGTCLGEPFFGLSNFGFICEWDLTDIATDSGECGDDVTWTFNTDTGVLIISGSGDMTNYSYGSVPWYSYRSDIETVVIAHGVTSIGEYAFANCISLTSVTIPNNITRIESGAFYWCSRLTSVTIPNSVTLIGNSAFYYCSSLTSVTIPNSVTSIGNSALANCSSLTSITISNNITRIEAWAFANCSSLTSVTIPRSVTSIGNSAFANCSSLTSVTIPNSVTSIGSSAFANWSSLTSVTIPDSVTSIGAYAFENCSKLTSAYFMGNVPASFGYSVFASNAPTFTIYYIEGKARWTSPTWTSLSGNVYNTATFIPDNTNTLTLPESSTYEIDDSGDVKYLEKVQPETKVSDILSAFMNTGNTVQVVTATGTVIAPTDTTTNIGTGYKVQLLDGDNNVVDEVIVVVKGEVTGDGLINSDDVIYLLRHTLLPTMYPVIGIADYTGDGLVNSDDAIYLLRHTLLPSIYPLD